MHDTEQPLPPTANPFLSLGSCKSHKFGSPEPCPPFLGGSQPGHPALQQQNSVLLALLKSIEPALTCWRWRMSLTFQTQKTDYSMADILKSQGHPPALQAGNDCSGWDPVQAVLTHGHYHLGLEKEPMWSPAPPAATVCPSPSPLKRLVSVGGEFPVVCLIRVVKGGRAPDVKANFLFKTPVHFNIYSGGYCHLCT